MLIALKGDDKLKVGVRNRVLGVPSKDLRRNLRGYGWHDGVLTAIPDQKIW